MSWLRSFREDPRLHANIGVGLALGLLVAACGWEVRHGEHIVGDWTLDFTLC